MKIIEKVTQGIVICLTFLITVFLLIQSIYGSVIIDRKEHVLFENDFMIVNILVILTVICLGIIIKEKYGIPMPTNKVMRIITVVYITALIAFIISVQVMPRADQEKCLYTAAKFLSGNYTDWEIGGYCYVYPNQNGLILLFSVIAKFFGEKNWLVVQFLNIPALIISAIYCSKTVYLLFEEQKLARYTYLILLAFVPMNCYVTFVYGTLFGLSAGSVGIYLIMRYCRNRKILDGVLSGVFIIFAIVCKSNYLIFLVAILLLLVYDSLTKKCVKSLGIVVIILGMYMISTIGVAEIIEYRTNFETGNGVPSTAWVAMGMQEGYRGPGWYNGYNANIFKENDYDIKKTKEDITQSMEKRLLYFAEHKGYALQFFGKKIASQWNEGTFQGFWINNVDVKKRSVQWSSVITQLMEDGMIWNKSIVKALNAYLSVLWTGVVLFLIFERNKISIYQLVYIIIFLGGFLFHMFWEAKGQYTIVYVYLLCPYMIKGYQMVLKAISNHVNHRENRRL